MNFNYQCSQCNKKFAITPDLMVCPDCSLKQKYNQPLNGILEVTLKGSISKDFTVFDLLCVERKFFPKIPVGNTPLWEPLFLRQTFNTPNLYIKDDSLNPTGSFKDRASFLVAAFAIKHNIKKIVLASTGNAGSSMAGIGAASGLDVILFLPKDVPKAKMIQALAYGAKVILIDGNYDLSYDLAMEYVQKKGGLSRSTAYNPLTLEGKKTVSLELYKQMGYKACDYIFVPTGDGCILGGVYKGFKDLLQLKLIDKMPIVYMVQAEKSDAIFRAYKNGTFKRMSSATLADSLSVDVPRNGFYALKQLKEFNGRCITVTDEEILKAQYELSKNAGIFTEPASAASFAGFKKAFTDIDKNSSIVILTTGSGLKDINTATRGVSLPKKTIKTINEI